MLWQASASRHQTTSVERSQLAREIQQLRVELSQKNLKLETVEADCQQKMTELKQKLDEALHQRQQLQVSLCLYISLVLLSFITYSLQHVSKNISTYFWLCVYQI